MPSLSLVTFVALALSPLSVWAHGQVTAVSANSGPKVDGPNIYYAGDKKNKNTPVRVGYKASGPAFYLPKDYKNAKKMSCEEAGPAPKYITVPAGGTLNIFWQGATGELDHYQGLPYHPFVHAMGPVVDYITPCTNGDCTKFDATKAGWTKIAQSGIDFNKQIDSQLKKLMDNKPEHYYPKSGKGLWALAKMQQQKSRWDVKIPKNLKPGKYIVRNELIALHNPLASAGNSGPQHYTACINVQVTGNGTVSLPNGRKPENLYDPKGSMAKWNVYNQDPHKFKIDGPGVWNAGN